MQAVATVAGDEVVLDDVIVGAPLDDDAFAGVAQDEGRGDGVVMGRGDDCRRLGGKTGRDQNPVALVPGYQTVGDEVPRSAVGQQDTGGVTDKAGVADDCVVPPDVQPPATGAIHIADLQPIYQDIVRPNPEAHCAGLSEIVAVDDDVWNAVSVAVADEAYPIAGDGWQGLNNAARGVCERNHVVTGKGDGDRLGSGSVVGLGDGFPERAINVVTDTVPPILIGVHGDGCSLGLDEDRGTECDDEDERKESGPDKSSQGQ